MLKPKLEANGIECDFFNFDYRTWLAKQNSNKMGISISGGADSAIGFYLMAKYLPNDIELVPWSMYEKVSGKVDQSRPYTIHAAEDVVEWVKTNLPEANIGKHIKLEFDRNDEAELAYVQANPIPDDDIYHPQWRVKDKGRVKMNQSTKLMMDSYNKGEIGVIINFRTFNPPQDFLDEISVELKHTKFHYEPRRSVKVTLKEKLAPRIYRPFLNVDKKFIAELYKQENLMETLFPLTESCIGFSSDTNGFSEPCRQCFWCVERYWAFGCYDGGVQ